MPRPPSPASAAGAAESAADAVAGTGVIAEPPDAPGWIALIERQLDRGDLAGARRSLRQLRERFPAHPVPPALLQRIGG